MSIDSAGNESPALNGWYELFSRGARDWLRHNEKIREAVRSNLPQIVSGADVISDGARTVRVPVRMLEHYRFRLLSTGELARWTWSGYRSRCVRHLKQSGA